MKAKIVVGLGWGDEGKGITTDYLTRKCLDPVVIRYTGGHQAGHTVVHDGIKHVAATFGSGSLAGAPTYLTEHCLYYPPNAMREYKYLQSIAITPKLTLHPLTKITTPYDVAYNRVLEKRNGHGSVGSGIGATMKRNETPYKLHAGDMSVVSIFLERYTHIKDYYLGKVAGELSLEEGRYFDYIVNMERGSFFEAIAQQKEFLNIDGYTYLSNFENLIFEGAQGIMLDQDIGIFPNVTHGYTTSRNAIEVCEKVGITDIEMFYITRCYITRHGNGWMPRYQEVELINNGDETNVKNEWQGIFKTTELDYDVLNYALTMDSAYAGKYPKRLVVTCLDQRPDFRLDDTKLKPVFLSVIGSFSPDSKDFKTLGNGQSESDSAQRKVTRNGRFARDTG